MLSGMLLTPIATGGSSTKSFRPEAKKEGGWVKTILEKKSIY